MKQARRLAAYAYTIGSETLASAALVLAKRKPKDRKALQLAALTKGGGAPPGYGFLRVGSPGSGLLVRVGSSSSSSRIAIPTGA